MQHFSNPVTATNERIIIWAALGFAEEKCVVFIIIILPHMERDHMNKLSILFQQ